MNLHDKSILVTGGGGFLGQHLVARLRREGCRHLTIPRRKQHDLTRPDDVEALLQKYEPQVVFHLAAQVGGIGANREHPGTFLYNNLLMGANLIEACRRRGVEKFLCVGTICSYPKFTPVPFRESSLWDGYPEETNAPYGLAKKILLVQLQAYRQEFGFPGIYVLPVNLYGPGDNFDLSSSHVIPALIRKCVEAQQGHAREVVIWGTGNATREFLYVEDAALALYLAAEKMDTAEPVNIGTGNEISIRRLATMIASVTGFTGALRFDPSQPDGQPRRCVDVTRARELFGFTAQTSFEEGIRRTVAWYRSQTSTRVAA